jgi:hypothetical protein
MTLGATNRGMREMSHGMQELTLRIAAIEGNAKRAFRRLVIWSFASAFAGGASVVLVYFVFKGG